MFEIFKNICIFLVLKILFFFMSKFKELIIQYDDIKKSLLDSIKEFVNNKGGELTLEEKFYINEGEVEISLQSLYIKNDKLYSSFLYVDDMEEDNGPINAKTFSGDTFRNLLDYLDKTF